MFSTICLIEKATGASFTLFALKYISRLALNMNVSMFFQIREWYSILASGVFIFCSFYNFPIEFRDVPARLSERNESLVRSLFT